VAAIHSQILKDDVFKEWYALYPERFQNKTNGITQRRWLGLCNPELSGLIAGKIGNGFLTDLYQLENLKPHINDDLCRDFIRHLCRSFIAQIADCHFGARFRKSFRKSGAQHTAATGYNGNLSGQIKAQIHGNSPLFYHAPSTQIVEFYSTGYAMVVISAISTALVSSREYWHTMGVFDSTSTA